MRISLRTRNRGLGFTFVEIILALTISLMVIGGATSLFVMSRKFLEEALWENRLRAKGAVFMEQAKSLINAAHSPDAPLAQDRIIVNASAHLIDNIVIPSSSQSGSKDRSYRIAYNATGKCVQITHNGTVINTLPYVQSINDFVVDDLSTSEGLVVLSITMRHTVRTGSTGEKAKQFTIVGRALPRNYRKVWNT